jgi:hypothetical protein
MKKAWACAAALVAAATPIVSAAAEQRTGRVDVVCMPEGQGNRIAFTLDYDRKRILGVPSGIQIMEWSDETIHWQLYRSRGGSYSERWYFVRRTGELGYFDPHSGDGHRYNCRRATSEERF